MLTTRQKTLRRFWYPVMQREALEAGPQPFRLLGEDIVLFLDAEGRPAALADRCCHRTAKLSKGWCENGQIVCGYHGWTYDRSGQCVKIPQYPDSAAISGTLRTPAYFCEERYGHVWVALDEPLQPIMPIPEDGMPGFRRILQFCETWNCAPLRLMENSFDTAHFSFVHRGTFGQFDQPKPEKFAITETDYGFEAETIITINNPPQSHRITGTTEPTTRRHFRNQWHLPFSRRLGMEYPNGLVHLIITSATPIADDRIQIVQWLYRNDTEADCPAQLLNDWDAKVVLEDKDILESTDADAPIDIGRRVEANMATDQPSLIMRRRLLELLAEHGEAEIYRAA